MASCSLDSLKQLIKDSKEYLDQADLILFLVDAKSDIMRDDRLIAQLLKKNKTPYVLVSNKIDSTKMEIPAEFKKLGLGNPMGIAATSGVGVGDLLDTIVKKLKLRTSRKEKELGNITRVTIVGKPNVGKSSLLNQILGEEKCIVSATPHTTREPQDTLIEYNKEKTRHFKR